MQEIETAVRGAKRLRMQGLEDVTLGDSVVKASARAWKNNLEERLSRVPIERILLESDSSLLREVVHRCANRRRPCSDEGEEFRDALLWLGLLNHMETRGTSSPVALIATDNHFTVGNGNHKLHPELKEDLDSRGLDLRYYFHLGQFLEENGIMTDDSAARIEAGLRNDWEIEGYLRVDEYKGAPKFVLRSAHFSLEGSGEEGRVAAGDCMPCKPGARISLESRFVGLLGAGRARVHDVSYQRLYYSGGFDFSGEGKLDQTATDPVVTVSAPFEFRGQLWAYERSWMVEDGERVIDWNLMGRGTATVELHRRVDSDDEPRYYFQSIEYRFNQ